MILVKLIEFLRRRLQAVCWICAALILALIGWDIFLVDKEHAHTAAEHWPLFWSVFGFLGCAVIIFASKAFGHAGIMTREDYYDE